MVVAESIAPPPMLHRGDYRSWYPGRTWEQFKLIQQGFENAPGIRLFYYKGTIELLMPGRDHELFKRIIALLLDSFLCDREIEFTPTGSVTQEIAGVAAVEADDSYEIQGKRLSIEVTFTSGNANKLERYQMLGVDEVWFWEDGVLAVYHLQGDRYETVQQSQIPALNAIDLKMLARCILLGETSRLDARKAFLAAHPR